MKSLFRKSKSKNIKNKHSNKNINFHKNKKKKSSKKLKFRTHSKTIKKNIKHKHKRYIRHQKGGMFDDVWRFKHNEHFESYVRYIFGSQRRAILWTDLLEECSKQQVPVIVITSGNRSAIERMLQLTEVYKYIREVLSIRKDEKSNPNPRFPHLTKKAQVIAEILKELEIPCESGETVGAFIDDQDFNFDDVPPCIERIRAININQYGKRITPTDSFEKEQPENIFYRKVFKAKNLAHALRDEDYMNHFNYIPEFILKTALWGISKRDIPEGEKPIEKYMKLIVMFRKIRVLLLDCDGVISASPGVFSLEEGDFDIDKYVDKIPNPVGQESLEVVEPVGQESLEVVEPVVVEPVGQESLEVVKPVVVEPVVVEPVGLLAPPDLPTLFKER